MTNSVTPAWPAASGAVARMLRARDWSTSPLGAPPAWPAGLRAIVELMLGSPEAMALAWGVDDALLFNDAYAALLGEDAAGMLGMPAATASPLHDVRRCRSVVATGDSARLLDQHHVVVRAGVAEDAWFDVSCSSVRNDVGIVAGVLLHLTETTPRVRAERGRSATEARQSFLLALSDTLRPIADAQRIQATATRLLGEHLGVDRVYYAEIEGEPGAREALVKGQYARTAAPLPDRLNYEAFEPARWASPILVRGDALVIDDAARDPRPTEAARAALRGIGLGALVVTSLVKDGCERVNFGVFQDKPRHWTAAEVELVREVAERTWAAAERARAEDVLRLSEAKYRGLFGSIDTAFSVIEVVFDADGVPVDYVILEANPAFVAQTGLTDVVGASIRTIVPEQEEFWFEVYGHVARTGDPRRVEHRARALDRWYSVYAFRLDDGRSDRVAVLFHDVSARKRREGAAMLLDQVGRHLAGRSSADAATRAVAADIGAHLDLIGCRFHVGEQATAIGWGLDEPTDVSTVTVAVEREGHRSGSVTVAAAGTRDWRDDELALLHEVTDRVVARVEQLRAQAALHATQAERQLMLQLMPAMLWWADPDGRLVTANDRWRHFTGQHPDEAKDFGWLHAIHPDDVAATHAAFAHAFATGEPLERHQRIRRADGAYRWHVVRHVPVRDGEDGAVQRWFGAATDVHELHQLQERQETLVAELQHRVRNILTVVRSVFDRTVDVRGSLEDIVDHFRGRLDALARTQVIVTRSASGLVDLDELIRDELLSVGAADGPDLTICGPDVALVAEIAQPIALALHELTTNSIKYGALKIANARLSVEWTVKLEQGVPARLDLRWSEQGVPAIVHNPARMGFGLELITEALPYQLGAETAFELRGGGLRCTLSVPLTKATRAAWRPA